MKHTVDTLEVESGWMVLKGHNPNRRMAKGTLVIGDDRVFTESEVRAILEDLADKQAFEGSIYRSDLIAVAAKYGIAIDPA